MQSTLVLGSMPNNFRATEPAEIIFNYAVAVDIFFRNLSQLESSMSTNSLLSGWDTFKINLKN